jgi:serine/threonine protein kinase/Tfp pilus assembly protein PilF
MRRRVALKIIKLGMDTKEVIARFGQERQSLAMMDHPPIAKIFDAGATGRGRPYFVMELVRGVRITEYCDRADLPTAWRLALFIQVYGAVQHAHQKGIIHRDLKPPNILVSLHDGVPVPKVIDFGVAKATAPQPLGELTVHTRLEQIIGTPAYMSPEQAGLSGLDIDTRSDIYGLGILLYELLTGKPPFDAGSLLSAGYEEMRRIIREVEPPRPSLRLSTVVGEERTALAKAHHVDPSKVTRLVQPDLDWIVMKAIEKDRSRRYATANALSLDIGRFLAGEPVSACPPGAGYRFRKFAKRHKFAFGASSAVLAALILGLGLSLWESIEKTRALQRAIASERKSSEVAGFLKEMLNGVGPSVALGKDTALLKEILDKTAERVGTDLRGQPEVEYQLRNTLGEVYRAIAENRKAEAMHRRAIELGRTLYGGSDPRVAESKNNLALVLTDEGHYDEAEKEFREAIDIYRKVRKSPDEDLAASLNNLGMVYRDTGKLPEAEALQRESLAMIRELHGADYVKAGYCEINLSIVLQRRGKQEEAESSAHSAVAIFRKADGKDNPETALALGNLAQVLEKGGKLPQAEIADRESLAMRRTVLDPTHPEIARNLMELASILSKQGKLAEAEEKCREALAILRDHFGSEHRFFPFVLDELGRTLEAREKSDDAAAIYEEALAMRRKLLEPNRPDIVRSLKSLSLLRSKQRHFEESEILTKEALEITLRMLGPDNPNLIEIYRQLGLIAEGRERYGDGEAFFRSALDCQRKDPNASPANTADLLECMGRMLALEQKYAESEQRYREALAICDAPSGIAPGIPGNIRSQLGAVLLSANIASPQGSDAYRRARFTEAEKLLTAGLEMMQRDPKPLPAQNRDAFESLSRLYTAWNHSFPDPALPIKAADFEKKLRELNPPQPPPR